MLLVKSLTNYSPHQYYLIMNMQYHHEHSSHANGSGCACVVSCDGRNHDISNLISPHCDYSYFVSPQTIQTPPRRVSRSDSLYPDLKEMKMEELKDCEAPCLKEWMSDTDYVCSERRQLPLHLQKTRTSSSSPNRVSFSSEDMVQMIDVQYENPAVQEDHPMHYEEEEEEDDHEHPMLEISPGVRVPYIGTAARTRALIKFSTREQRTTVQTVCLGCQASLVSMGNIKYLACVACHSVSPLDLPVASGDPRPRGAGIGLLVEEAELLRRRAHSNC